MGNGKQEGYHWDCQNCQNRAIAKIEKRRLQPILKCDYGRLQLKLSEQKATDRKMSGAADATHHVSKLA
jgi:hypothetical protein